MNDEWKIVKEAKEKGSDKEKEGDEAKRQG